MMVEKEESAESRNSQYCPATPAHRQYPAVELFIHAGWQHCGEVPSCACHDRDVGVRVAVIKTTASQRARL